MAAQTRLVTGPAGCGKTQQLLDLYRAAVRSGPPGSALWLAPSARIVTQIRQWLLNPQLGACFSPQCYTFGQFAGQVVAASGRSIRPVSRLQQREVLRELILRADGQGQLPHFKSIAQTSGFLDLLIRFVREMKRLEVWPEHLASAADRSPSDSQRELVHLYADYQRVLNQHGLYDAQGRFWSARAPLRDGQTRPFTTLREIYVDGFTDFTRTEHEILELLAERGERMVISLPLEAEPCRRDLFAKTLRTRDELHARHPQLSIEQLPAAPSGFSPALRHITAHLFRPSRSVPAPQSLDGFEVIPAASQRAEYAAIAGRIKRLLVDGDPKFPGRVVPCAIFSWCCVRTHRPPI